MLCIDREKDRAYSPAGQSALRSPLPMTGLFLVARKYSACQRDRWQPLPPSRFRMRSCRSLPCIATANLDLVQQGQRSLRHTRVYWQPAPWRRCIPCRPCDRKEADRVSSVTGCTTSIMLSSGVVAGVVSILVIKRGASSSQLSVKCTL